MFGRIALVAVAALVACDGGGPPNESAKIEPVEATAVAKVLHLESEDGKAESTDADGPGTESGTDSREAGSRSADGALPAPAPHFSRTTLETTVSGEGEGPYKFTASWHTRRAKRWAGLLESYRGRKALNYLEIGVFEGRSLLWMFDNVLTEASSRATVVDPFFDDYELNYDHNIAASSVGKRVRKIKALSENGLRDLAANSFDIIYVDGSHTADDVLVDAVLSWDLLREGGLLIFDDYRWGGRPKGNPIPPELRPAVAVDAFITAHRYEIEIVDRGAQVWLKKKRNPCGVKDYCTPYRDHLYLWREYALRTAEGETVALTPEEIRVLERLLGSTRFGEVKIRLNREIRKDPVYLSLKAKLDGKP